MNNRLLLLSSSRPKIPYNIVYYTRLYKWMLMLMHNHIMCVARRQSIYNKFFPLSFFVGVVGVVDEVGTRINIYSRKDFFSLSCLLIHQSRSLCKMFHCCFGVVAFVVSSTWHKLNGKNKIYKLSQTSMYNRNISIFDVCNTCIHTN